MSELTINPANESGIRRRLLTTVSLLALLGIVGIHGARAGDSASDRPTVWIELGAQLDRIDGGQQPLAPPFLTGQPRPDFENVSPLATQRLPRYGIDMDGKLSFAPRGSDWVFSAAVRYGRSNDSKHVHQQTPGVVTKGGPIQGMYTANGERMVTLPARFDDTKVEHDESHTIIDFMAGKDVGLGLFGRGSDSVFNFGVRFAQFHVKSGVGVQSNPDLNITHHGAGLKYKVADPHHSYYASQHTDRSFRGIGPSISWDASAPVLGNRDEAQVNLDWGINAAVLFGRQKADVQHSTSGIFKQYATGLPAQQQVYPPRAANLRRSRSVVVPNVGGFAGLSMRYSNAKVSFGYRADIFFNAVDGGIDARKTSDRAFYGPFAAISLGL